jgi:hypothetical protein
MIVMRTEAVMKLAGAGILVLSIAIAVVPFLTRCHSEGAAMRCELTAHAALAGAVVLAVLAAILGWKRSGVERSLSMAATFVGFAIALLPTHLIGVCGADTMPCNMIMKPALLLSGILVMALGTAAFLMSRSLTETV